MSEYNQSAEIPLAVALKYNPDKDNAPIVVAAGNGDMAQRIIDLASKHNVPIYQDNATAAMLSNFQLGAQVPPALYQVIAEIYAYILHANHEVVHGEEFTPISLDELSKE